MSDSQQPLDISLNQFYDDCTRKIISQVLRPGLIGIDVGAHVGEILRAMVVAAPDERHIAVEPIPGLAAGLRADFPTVAVHEVALAAESGDDVLFHHVVSNPGYSGLRQRRYESDDESIEVISVRTTRLDDLVLVGDNVGLIKIDVEGGELGVLEGATKTLESRPVVVFEHGLGAADHYGTTPTDVWSIFDQLTMRVSLLDAFLVDGPSLTQQGLVDQFQSGENFYFVAHP